MQIKNISITNFRSYYGTTVFEINDGLTLIIGDNGDGKTTFFEALEWLFDTNYLLPKTDNKYISQKRISKMLPGDSDVVRVTMEFEHDGNHTIERSFSFTRNMDGSITMSNFDYALYSGIGVERVRLYGKSFEKIFDTAIRKYSLFKGESELNIFNNVDAIKLLVETFSELKNFDPYVNFAKFAENYSKKALENAVSSDKKNAKQAKALKSDLESVRAKISDLLTELHIKQGEAADFTSLLENLEQNKEAASQLKDVNDRLESLGVKRDKIRAMIKENYTVKLLDEMWVLCGFESIAREYGDKINKFRKEKKHQEIRFIKEQGAQQAIKHIQDTLSNGAVPLPIHVPDENTMREMLKDHICKVCGREAPEGSDAYNFMKDRLDAYLESLKLNEESEEEKNLFLNDYVTELDKRATLIHNDMDFFSHLPQRIIDDIEFNTKRKIDLQTIESNIAATEDDKKKILAQAKGVNEEQLKAAYSDISNWWNLKNEAEKRIIQIENSLNVERALEEELQEKYDKVTLESTASSMQRTNMALRKIHNAFESAKQQNKRDFLDSLEKIANDYLQKLNVEDFTGIIRLVERPDGSAIIELRDSNGIRIFNPNTALKTTVYMSILFAVSELTTIKKDNDYPLIFDAPTSSFANAKESDFFRVISNIKKQTIIVTKSFLREGKNGHNEVDTSRVQSLKGTVYRIDKVRPFDNKDLSSIQTVALKIK